MTRVNANGNPDNRTDKERFEFRLSGIKNNPDFKIEEADGGLSITVDGNTTEVKTNDADALDDLFRSYIYIKRGEG